MLMLLFFWTLANINMQVTIYDRPRISVCSFVHMTDHAGPDVASVTQELSFGTRPSKLPSFGTWGAVLAPVSVFERPNKNKFISMKQSSNFNHFQQLLCHTFPPPLDQYNLFWPYKKRATKPGAKTGLLRWAGAKS